MLQQKIKILSKKIASFEFLPRAAFRSNKHPTICVDVLFPRKCVCLMERCKKGESSLFILLHVTHTAETLLASTPLLSRGKDGFARVCALASLTYPKSWRA